MSHHMVNMLYCISKLFPNFLSIMKKIYKTTTVTSIRIKIYLYTSSFDPQQNPLRSRVNIKIIECKLLRAARTLNL